MCPVHNALVVFSVCQECPAGVPRVPLSVSSVNFGERVGAFWTDDSVWRLYIVQTALRVWSASTVYGTEGLQGVCGAYSVRVSECLSCRACLECSEQPPNVPRVSRVCKVPGPP